MTTSGTKDDDIKTVYEIFREGKLKYQLVWTNNSKEFFIDGELVTEVEWDEALKKDKK
jgi:hypothetical protein